MYQKGAGRRAAASRALRFTNAGASSMDFPLSDYGRASATPAPVSRMMAAFASGFREGCDINLGVGYVNESTIPRHLAIAAMQAVLGRPGRYRNALNYGGPRGSPTLVESLRRFILDNAIGCLTPEALDRRQIIVGPSGATSLLEGIAAVARPGIVITADPMYYIYCDVLERRGFRILAVPEDAGGISVDALDPALAGLGDARRDISFIYVATVGNPTCTILSNQRRRQLVDATQRLSASLGRTVPLMLDTAYESLVHDPAAERPQSALLHDPAGIVHEVGTLSKILAPALRIGYMIAADSPLVRALVQHTGDVGFSAPLILQEMAGWLLDNHAAGQIEKVNRGYREKAVSVRAWIDELLGEHIEECRGGRAGFYFYLTFHRIETSEGSRFFRCLARTTGDAAIDGPAGSPAPRVAYIPGQFCVHRTGSLAEVGRRQLRLSYGFEELPRIRQALELMRDAAAWASR